MLLEVHFNYLPMYALHTSVLQARNLEGTWMNLETMILSKLTQEQKTKHRVFSLIGQYSSTERKVELLNLHSRTSLKKGSSTSGTDK
ncbi:retrotransposable element ORF2 protein [Plecturocebus cupreus]